MATDGHRAITEPEPISPKELSSARFLKGKLLAVDCSAPPNAMLTILGGAKTWKLRVKDSGRVIVIGADKFSCAWKNQSVAVNYRATANADGEVVSVEVQ